MLLFYLIWLAIKFIVIGAVVCAMLYVIYVGISSAIKATIEDLTDLAAYIRRKSSEKIGHSKDK